MEWKLEEKIKLPTGNRSGKYGKTFPPLNNKGIVSFYLTVLTFFSQLQVSIS